MHFRWHVIIDSRCSSVVERGTRNAKVPSSNLGSGFFANFRAVFFQKSFFAANLGGGFLMCGEPR